LHADAELATARAAVEAGTVSIVSTDSHYPFPAVAAVAGKNCWFQLYPYRTQADVEAMIDMVLDAGAAALVVTVDARFPARRISARRAGFRTPPHVDFGTLRLLGILAGDVPADARLERLPLTWDDLARIRRRVKVPLLVKGVLHPADARRCCELGADGVIVSNHGGRQLDGVVPSLVALEEVAGEVRDHCAVLFDGGIRSGVDVVKALALGAHAVCIGRPYLWGLSIGGEAGVKAVLTLLQREVEDTLLQLGLAAVSDIRPDCVAGIRWSPPTAAGRPHEGG
jgi:4-hydroxymandelate oxidase